MAASESILQSSYTYLPNSPPSKAIKPSYSRFILSAPVAALAEVTPHARTMNAYPASSHCRLRVQVGNTNRWRLPNALGSDLLGTSQAIKAVTYSNARNRRELKTAHGFRQLQFLDVSQSYGEPNSDTSSCKLQESDDSSGRKNCHEGRKLASSARSFHKHANSSKNSRNNETSHREPLSTASLNHMHRGCSHVPPEQRKPTPVERFLHISQLVSNQSAPDFAVKAFNFTWYLHRRHAEKSMLLSRLIKESNESDSQLINDSASNTNQVKPDTQGITVSIQKQFNYPCHMNGLVCFHLDVDDKLISKHVFASALCALYGDLNFDTSDVIGILAASHLLQVEDLKNRCAELLMHDINACNACIFHTAAKKYSLPQVHKFCEKWLELNIVPLMSSSIYLSHVTLELLEKLLKSQQLFTYDEYSLFKLLCNWIFLKLHPDLQLQAMPFWGTVVTWFMSIPKKTSFLEQDEGKKYRALFSTLRLNGITNPGQLDEITKMNVLPADWLLKVFSQHYYSLQGGGDMSLMTRFETGAIRYGFVLDKQNANYKEMLSLHGFHYDMRAELHENCCNIYMQRLRPTDPVISQRISERQTFSVRQDREVRYSIKAQFRDRELFQTEIIGPKSQCFGMNNKSERSEVLKVNCPVLPLYVTFYLLFPPS